MAAKRLNKKRLDKTKKTLDGKFLATTISGIQYIKVWSKTFPDGKLFKLWLFISGRMFLLDDESKLWIYYVIPAKFKVKKKNFLSMPCQIYCSKRIRRFHRTCSWCRARRIIEGKAPNPARCSIYIDIIHHDIKLGRVRKRIIKELNSIKELVGAW